jgi:hypothetical protein
VLGLAIKAATKDQWHYVEKIFALLPAGAGIDAERAAYRRGIDTAKALLDECGDAVGCYLPKLADATGAEGDADLRSQKAAMLIGILGGSEVKTKLVERVPEIRSADVRRIVIDVLLAKSPEGDPAVVARLEELIERIERTRDLDKIVLIAEPLDRLVRRLRARSGSPD